MSTREPAAPVPQRIGPYEIVGRIAAGGMAEVFAGRARGIEGMPAVVAVKQPRRDVVDEKRMIEMFLDEARLASLVRSPYCVDMLELGQDDDGHPYLVMPLVVGVSLARLLSVGGALAPRVAVELGAQIGQGLHDAHIARGPDGAPLGIVHRDVSPHNVLIGIDGRARVADFGVARAYSRITRTRTGQVKGKLGYLSPEQIQGQPVDARADVFALGIVVWEMLAGRRLVRAKTYVEAHHALTVAQMPDVRKVSPDVPDALAAVVQRALERDRDARWPDAASMVAALRASIDACADEPEIAALVRERADGDVRRLSQLAAAATGSGAWSIDVTALPSSGDHDPDTEPTRLSAESGDATLVSGAPLFEVRGSWLTRAWRWLRRLFGS